MNFAKYIGIPYLPAGRTREGVDCAGLVIMVFRDMLGVELPDTVAAPDYDPDNPEFFAKGIGPARSRFVRVAKPRACDVVLMSRGRQLAHLGITLDSRHFIHCSRKTGGVVKERLASSLWRRRIEGFYRHG